MEPRQVIASQNGSRFGVAYDHLASKLCMNGIGAISNIANRCAPVSVIFSITLSLLVASPPARADDNRMITSMTPISVKAFGAKGDGSTDDTAAIEKAIKAALATREHPCVTFPAGIYKVSATLQLSDRGVCLQGTTPWNTFIDSAAEGPIFNLGTFSPGQSPPWTGTADDLTVMNLTLENSTQTNVAFTGSRVTTGIQSNGSGRIVMEDVQFAGLKYGFAAPYGSDFDRFKNIWLASNDVGLYMGPSSQQFSISAVEAHTNGEAFVCDGCGQGTLSESAFVDSMTADITFEREQPTRFGWKPARISAYDADSYVAVKDNWFETGAGYGGISSWQEYRRILLKQNINDTSYPRHISIQNSFLVLGSTGIAPKDGNVHSFVELDSGKFITVDNVEVVGDRRDCEIYGNGGASVAATNVQVEDGYSSLTPVFLFASGTSLSNDFSYTPQFKAAEVPQSIPSSCLSPHQLLYDTPMNKWLGCITDISNSNGGLANSVSIGSVLAALFRSASATFRDLSAASPGTQVWCTDCKATKPCTGGGAGAFAFRTSAGTWYCPF